jgi:hypothetical protein
MRRGPGRPKGIDVLYTVVLILIVCWLLGWLVFPVVGGLIHLVLFVAVIVFVVGLLRGRSA